MEKVKAVIQVLDKDRAINAIPQDVRIQVKTEISLKSIVFQNDLITLNFEVTSLDKEGAQIQRYTVRAIEYLWAVLDFTVLQWKNNYRLRYYRLRANNWEEIFPNNVNALSYVDLHPALDQDHVNQLITFMAGKWHIPLSFELLKATKSITDLRSRYVTTYSACELGVKDFFGQVIPETRILLNSLPSPSVSKLLGSVYKGYFHKDFPTTIKSGLHSIVEKRNRIVHTETENASFEDCYHAYSVVLSILNELNRQLSNGLFNPASSVEFFVHQKGKKILSKFPKEISDLYKDGLLTVDLGMEAYFTNDGFKLIE